MPEDFSRAEISQAQKRDKSVQRTSTPARERPAVRKETNLGAFDLNPAHTPEGSTRLFGYYTRTYTVREFVDLLPDLDRREQILQALAELGVADLSFSVHARQAARLTESQLKSATVYVCAHGWTATEEIYTNVLDPDKMSVVTRILDRDPAGVVVTVDAPGFGKSQFSPEVLNSDAKLHEALLTKNYARTLEVLIKMVLGVEDLSRVALKAHSRGARAALELTMNERQSRYKRVELDAPAIALNKKWRHFIHQQLRDRKPSDFDDLIAQIWGNFTNENAGSVVGVRVSATLLYEALGLSIGTASAVSQLGALATKIGVGITKTLFGQVLYGDLFGQIVTPRRWNLQLGEEGQANQQMWDQLLPIHMGQLQEGKGRPRQQFINSVSIRQLNPGLDFGLSEPSLEKLDVSQFIPLSNTWVIAGEQDTLATLADIRESFAAMAVLALLKYEFLSQNGAHPEALSEAAQAFISASTLLPAIKQPGDSYDDAWRGRFHVIKGGHYAVVYYPGDANTPSFEEILIHDEEVPRTSPRVSPW